MRELKKKRNIKVPVAAWVLNHTKRGGGGRQTRRFRSVEPLSMVSFTEPLSRVWCSSTIQFPHSVGQEENLTQAEEGLRRIRRGGKSSTL